MYTEGPHQANKFTRDFTNYEVVGYHGTSAITAERIEVDGFFPSKVFEESFHHQFFDEVRKVGNVDPLFQKNLNSYQQWLNETTFSITFTPEFDDALNHVKSGKAGGQGIWFMYQVAEKMLELNGSKMAQEVVHKIDELRAESVIYAVDLTNLGDRLVWPSEKKTETPFFHIYINPDSPQVTPITPDRLLAKLLVG